MLDLGVAAGAMFVQRVEQSQKVAKQTEAVLKSTGGAGVETAGAVGDLANEISRKTGIDDEAIQSAQNWLLTFKEGPATRRAKATTSSTARPDDDRPVGGDEGGAAGREPARQGAQRSGEGHLRADAGRRDVLGEPEGADQAARRAERPSRCSEDHPDEVESQVEGSAEAQATAYDKAKVSAGNLAETVGGLLAPAVESAANAASGAADWFQELDSWQQQAIVGAAGAGMPGCGGDQIGSVASLMRRSGSATGAHCLDDR